MAVPTRPDWLYEVKQGFRLIVQRDVDRVRLFTRNGMTGQVAIR